MREKDPKEKEIQSILAGRTILLQDGRLALPGEDDFRIPIGMIDGAGSVQLFGLVKSRRIYQAAEKQKKTMEAARRAMQNIGRGVLLREQPDTVACFARYILTRPVVLTFCYEGETPVLTAYTGKGIAGIFARWKALSAFHKALPANSGLTLYTGEALQN